jgi:hypothetical protein
MCADLNGRGAEVRDVRTEYAGRESQYLEHFDYS